MAGEMIMPNTTTTTNPSTSNNTTVAPTSNIVELKNMLTEQDLQSTEDYNEILEEISETRPNCLLVKVFDDFIENMSRFYLDKGHPNELGYKLIAEKIINAVEQNCRI